MPVQPGFQKRNAATEVADMVKQMNADRGVPAGRIAGAAIQAVTGPRVSSAEMLAGPRELSPAEQAEQAELDRKARSIGIMPPLEEEESTPDNRMTAREIMEAALPMREIMETALPVDTPAQRSIGKLTKEFIAQFPEPAAPRLPDFTKIQGIDLIRNVAYVDTFEIPLPDAFVNEVKGVVLNLAVNLVTEQLAKAMVKLNLVPPTESEETKKSEEGPHEPLSGEQIPLEIAPTEEVQCEREGSSETAS